MNHLVILFEGAGDREVELQGPVMSFGRAKDNAILLDDGRVSSRHGQFEQRDGGWHLVDVGSSNGTFVNGTRLEIKGLGHRLRAGDRVDVGPFTIVFTERRTQEPGGHTFRGSEHSPEASRAALSQLLERTFVDVADRPPAERQAALRQALQDFTAEWPPRHLAEVLSHFVQGTGRDADTHRSRAELDRHEQLLRASHAALVSLAKVCTGTGRLDSPQEVERLEALLRQGLLAFVRFLSESLEARSRYGGNFDLDVTRIVGLPDNPLKSEPTPEGIAAFLFDPRRETTPDAVAHYLAEAIELLKLHQLAMVTCARDAARALLVALDPEKIEERDRVENSGLRLRSPWKTYVKVHEEYSSEPQVLHDLIEPGIKEGYRQFHRRMLEGRSDG